MAGFGKKLLGFIGLEEADELEETYYDGPEEEPEPEPDYLPDDYEPVEEVPTYSKKVRPTTGKFLGTTDPSKVSLLIYKPSSYEETQNIIDNLKNNRPIIVNLDELDTDVAQRILDFISGAVYALSGNIRKAARNIFVVAPNEVDVSTNLSGESMSAAVDDFDANYFPNGGM
ncbi:MAG: cell division protein SepF [Clostridia bacterium]|nr:cell division protein SepF [Clostridia bacterium]